MSHEPETKLVWVWLHGECSPSAQVFVEVPGDVADDEIEDMVNSVADDFPKDEFQHVPKYVFDVSVTEIEVVDRGTNVQRGGGYKILRNDQGAWELTWD